MGGGGWIRRGGKERRKGIEKEISESTNTGENWKEQWDAGRQRKQEVIEKRSMAGQKKGRKKDGGCVKEGGLRGREAPAGRCNVSSGWEIRQPSLCWLPPTVPSPPTLHSLNTHSHRLTSPVADLQRFSTEALEIRGKWWKSAFISTLACNLRMQQLFPCSFLPASVPRGVLVWGKKQSGENHAVSFTENIWHSYRCCFFFLVYQLSVVIGCKEGIQCAREGKRKDLIIAIGFMRKEVLSRRPFNLSDTLRHTTLPKYSHTSHAYELEWHPGLNP